MASEELIKQEIEKREQELKERRKQKNSSFRASFAIAILEVEISILEWVLHE